MAPLKTPGVRVGAHPHCVKNLNRIIEETGAAIVVSSAWRLMRRYPTLEMREILSGWGVIGSVVGCTPEITEVAGRIFVSRPRGAEIQKWLDEDGDRFDIESFVIIDDDADMEHLAPRLIKTSFEAGLTEENADAAIAMLKEGVVAA